MPGVAGGNFSPGGFVDVQENFGVSRPAAEELSGASNMFMPLDPITSPASDRELSSAFDFEVPMTQFGDREALHEQKFNSDLVDDWTSDL
jgi:hypothetical protein